MRRLSILFAACGSLAVAACDGPPVAAGSAVAEALDSHDLRRVWSDSRDYGKPSPDGRLITFVDWTTGDVAVYDVATRAERRVTDKGTWQANGSWAEEPRFSPDGRRIVYSYGNTERVKPFLYELRMVTLDDTTQHLVHATQEGEYVVPLDWHESAGVLAIVDRAAGLSDLLVVDPDSRATRLVRTFQPDEPDPHRGGFSNDARFIAYQYGRDLRVMDASGAHDRSLDEQGTLLGWAPDGGGVLFHGARAGTRGIWFVPLREGRRAGATTLVRDGIPALSPGGFSRTAYFYTVPVDGPKVHLAMLDIENGRVLAPPIQITSPADGFAHAPAWTPDGSGYAYILNTPGTKPRIMLRSADGEQLRELATLDVSRVQSLLWTPDGRSLIVVGAGTAEMAAYRIDVTTGETTKLFEPAGPVATLTPDGRTLVYLRSSGVYARALDGGAERTLATARGAVTDVAVSPDGATVAHVRGRGEGVGRIVAYPIGGGDEREIAVLPEGWHFESHANTLAWTYDGRHLLAVMGDRDQNHSLVAVPLAGGPPRTLLELGQRGEGPARAHAKLHPDGRRVLYADGAPRSEMWMLASIPGARR